MAKKTKKNLSGLKNLRKRLQEQHNKKRAAISNPFEVRENKRQKQVVLNRKTKGSQRNVALARALAHEKRKRTLLKDYQTATKSSLFQDRRFGENNTQMTEEEKILARFKHSRSKKTIYNLPDPHHSTNQHSLTHLGQSLSTSDAANKDASFWTDHTDDHRELEPDPPKLDPVALMEQLKTWSSDGTKKSKKQVMEEVIAKAKLFKMERQREKEHDNEQRDRLDEMFNNLLSQPGLFNVRPSKRQRQEEKPKMGAIHKHETNIDDDYEQIVRELTYELRAKATDRTLTPEEKARRDLRELEEKQIELQRRMQGDEEDEDDYDGRRRKRRKAMERPTDDQLDDLRTSISSLQHEQHIDDNDASHEDEEDTSNPDQEISTQGDEDIQHNNNQSDIISFRLQEMIKAQHELPYLIDAPTTHVQFIQLLSSYKNPELEAVIQRIRKTNSIHLKAENRAKMSKFYKVLLDHLVHVVEVAARTGESCTQDTSFVIDALFEIAQEMPNVAAQTFSTRLARMQKTLQSQLQNLNSNAHGGDYGQDVALTGRAGVLATKKKAGGHKVRFFSPHPKSSQTPEQCVHHWLGPKIWNNSPLLQGLPQNQV